MTKKTVSDAVDYYKGVWPQQDHDKETMVFGIYSREFWAQSCDDLDPEDEQLVCTRAEFEAEVERRKAADELTQLGQAMGDYDMGWDGDGLPPVGCECEFRAKGGSLNNGHQIEWQRCEVEHTSRHYAILRHIGDEYADIHEAAHSLDTIEFRPLKTKEERDREESIKDMMSHLSLFPDDFCGKLYDAGYRLNKP